MLWSRLRGLTSSLDNLLTWLRQWLIRSLWLGSLHLEEIRMPHIVLMRKPICGKSKLLKCAPEWFSANKYVLIEVSSMWFFFGWQLLSLLRTRDFKLWLRICRWSKKPLLAAKRVVQSKSWLFRAICLRFHRHKIEELYWLISQSTYPFPSVTTSERKILGHARFRFFCQLYNHISGFDACISI